MGMTDLSSLNRLCALRAPAGITRLHGGRGSSRTVSWPLIVAFAASVASYLGNCAFAANAGTPDSRAPFQGDAAMYDREYPFIHYSAAPVIMR